MTNFIKRATGRIAATIGAAALYVLFSKSVQFFEDKTRKY